MSVKDKSVKDKTSIDFNYLTGKFDLVRVFNPDRIVTHEKNAAGTMLMTYDPASQTHIQAGPEVVTDNDGNVVVVG
jgi:hypothetical protein